VGVGRFHLCLRGFSAVVKGMTLPTTGTAGLLEVLSPYIPDAEIQALLPRRRGGRPAEWSSAQLLRVLLLLLLTPARSTNLLCRLLPEQQQWRRFAHLPNLRRLPNARQLHEFRARLTPSVLRSCNGILLHRILATWPQGQPGVALIDATDLPAAANEYKKSPAAIFRRDKQRWVDAPSRRGVPAISSGIRSTLCVCGWRTISPPNCSSP
jgi:hypothetical protein